MLIVNSDVSQGKVPSKSDIPDLIKCYNKRFDILRSSPENNQDDNEHVNPVKSFWKKKGIHFPGRSPVPNSTAVNQKQDSVATTGARLLNDFAEPNSKREEEYLLQIGLNQSLQSIQHDSEYTERHHSTHASTTTTEEDVGGLGLLFEAAILLENE